MNIYEQYIIYLRKLESLGLDPNQGIEKHHITPLHVDIKSTDVVYCSTKNHTLAHFYRFLAFRERGDWVAYTMRKNQKTNAFERSLLAVKKK